MASTTLVALIAVVAIAWKPDLSLAKASKQVSVNDSGFLYQDEVTKELIVDLHREDSGSQNPFEVFSGKFKPSSAEYRALLNAAGVSNVNGIKADENIQVKSLFALRQKFDEELKKIQLVEKSAELAEEQPQVTSSAAALPGEPSPEVPFTPTVTSFVELSEAGFSDPKLGDYRLIPLERGVMITGKAGEKRVFSTREVLKNDVFEVAIGESKLGKRVLAILHQSRSRVIDVGADNTVVTDTEASDSNSKYTVWVLGLSDSRIEWTTTLEFGGGADAQRSIAAASPLASKLTLSAETVSIALGAETKTLALKTGESADKGSLTPASEN